MQHFWKRALPNVLKSTLVGALFMLAAWVFIILRVKSSQSTSVAGWQWQFLFIALGFLLISIAAGFGITRPQPTDWKWSILIITVSTLVIAALSPLVVLPLASPARNLQVNIIWVVCIALLCAVVFVLSHFPLPWRRNG